MALAACEKSVWTPTTDEDKMEVRRQMNRLLETSHFKNSRRYPVLFRYIVEEALDGRAEFLKERLLGVRVFDRPPDYDTATDPIVRVTIAEIRKRIAQYYHEDAHDSEMRIELVPGSYVPEFRPSREAGFDSRQAARGWSPSEDEQTAEFAEVQVRTRPFAISSVRSYSKSGLSRWVKVKYALTPVVALLVILGTGLLWKWNHPSALDQLWGPFLASRRAVVFCLPVMSNSGEATAAAAGILVDASTANLASAAVVPSSDAVPTSTFLDYEILGQNIVYSDLLATLRIANYFAAHNRDSNPRPNTLTTLNDLRMGPAVLVGGLDNQWTLRALASLRYRFAGTDEEQYWILDTKNPAMKNWGLDLKVRLSDVQRDYAIIARVHDEATGQVEMIVAGIGMTGTAAAGEFLVDPRQIAELRRRVGSGFRDRDFEAVLSTDVVNGIAGTPEILAVAVR